LRAINCVRARDVLNGGSVVASDAVGVADAREAVRPPHGAAGHPATQGALPVATPSALESSLMVY
jgi:hypothetical protein